MFLPHDYIFLKFNQFKVKKFQALLRIFRDKRCHYCNANSLIRTQFVAVPERNNFFFFYVKKCDLEIFEDSGILKPIEHDTYIFECVKEKFWKLHF